ncbi:MAG: nucleoside transporter C-terminal domain-containing protein, partial [Bacteroidota bacterium]
MFRTLLGMTILLGVCYLLSKNRKAINWRLVAIGVGLQFILAYLMLNAAGVSYVVDIVATGFRKTLDFTAEGSEFLFGSIVQNTESFGYIFAFQVLPTIVFFSALTAVLYYLGVLQKVVYGLAWLLSRTMGLSGPESLAAAANVFIGQTEAPLVVKPYLERMTNSELLCLMVGGMATIAGSVYVAYVGMLGGGSEIEQQFFARHLLTASIISAPAAIVCAKMLVPENKAELAAKSGNAPAEVQNKKGVKALEKPLRDERLTMAADDSNNLLDAISRGTTDGLRLAVNVGAMLLVFTAMIYMVNQIFLGTTDIINYLVAYDWNNPHFWGQMVDHKSTWNHQISLATDGRFDGFSFSYLLAMLFAPVAWVIG